MSSEMFTISLSILCSIMHARIYYVVCYCTIIIHSLIMYVHFTVYVYTFYCSVVLAFSMCGYLPKTKQLVHAYVCTRTCVSVGSYLWCM